MFLLGMAKTRKDLNFLGLEINKKVSRMWKFCILFAYSYPLLLTVLQLFSACKTLPGLCSLVWDKKWVRVVALVLPKNYGLVNLLV